MAEENNVAAAAATNEGSTDNVESLKGKGKATATEQPLAAADEDDEDESDDEPEGNYGERL